MSSPRTLAVVVPVLETMLFVAGQGQEVRALDDTRESLRVRFRKATRLLQRWKADVDGNRDWSVSVVLGSNQGGLSYPDGLKLMLGNGARQPSALDNFFAERRQPARYKTFVGDLTGLSQFLTDHGTGRLDARPVQAPFLTNAVAAMDIAIHVCQHGWAAVYTSVIDLWIHRHFIPKSDTAKTKKPRQPLAIDRLCMALVRLVVGFFGSRKVDARNKP